MEIKIDLFFVTLLGTEMSLQPRFEDILHLVIWNGYVEECRQAVYVSKETYTDERIWFPFLIQQTYGIRKKTYLQVIADHCTYVKTPSERKLVLTKGGMLIYKPEKRWLRRIKQIQQMAIDSHHMKIFEKILGKADMDGNTILFAASKNNCPKIISYLLKRGVDYNQENSLGATPDYYAYNSKHGRHAWSSLLDKSKFKSKYNSPRSTYVHQLQPDRPHQNHFINLNVGREPEFEPEPPKKKLKHSEYKKQFGRR